MTGQPVFEAADRKTVCLIVGVPVGGSVAYVEVPSQCITARVKRRPEVVVAGAIVESAIGIAVAREESSEKIAVLFLLSLFRDKKLLPKKSNKYASPENEKAIGLVMARLPRRITKATPAVFSSKISENRLIFAKPKAVLKPILSFH
ncbi:MAG: hypothetical protein PHU39_02960 [Candidatus Pacebacteria bacterium]|nr:hypothetical protein [Candidatus Paceibacterota bacterium]